MRSTIPLGRIAGVPVGMHWSALIGIALLGQLVGLTVLPSAAPGLGAAAYWLAGGLAALGLGGSLLTHELAHAFVALRAGLGVRRITLWLLGGVSELVGQHSEPRAEVRIALAGPLTSLGLGGLLAAAMVLAHDFAVPAGVGATLSWLATMNILLGVFNLLPGTPVRRGAGATRTVVAAYRRPGSGHPGSNHLRPGSWCAARWHGGPAGAAWASGRAMAAARRLVSGRVS